MKWALGAVTLAGALIGQLALSATWPASVVFFDLPLLVVLYYGLDRGPTAGLSLGAVAGVVQDSLTGSLLGAGAVSRAIIGYAAGSAGLKLLLTRPLAQFLVACCGTLGARLLELLTLAVMGRQRIPPSLLDLLAGVAGNGLVGGAILALFRREVSP